MTQELAMRNGTSGDLVPMFRTSLDDLAVQVKALAAFKAEVMDVGPATVYPGRPIHDDAADADAADAADAPVRPAASWVVAPVPHGAPRPVPWGALGRRPGGAGDLPLPVPHGGGELMTDGSAEGARWEPEATPLSDGDNGPAVSSLVGVAFGVGLGLALIVLAGLLALLAIGRFG